MNTNTCAVLAQMSRTRNQRTRTETRSDDGYFFGIFRYVKYVLGLYNDDRSCDHKCVHENCKKSPGCLNSGTSPSMCSTSCSPPPTNTSGRVPSPCANCNALQTGGDSAKQRCDSTKNVGYDDDIVYDKLSFIITGVCSVIEKFVNHSIEVESQGQSNACNAKPKTQSNCCSKSVEPPAGTKGNPSVELPKSNCSCPNTSAGCGNTAAPEPKPKTASREVKPAAKNRENPPSCLSRAPVKRQPMRKSIDKKTEEKPKNRNQ